MTNTDHHLHPILAFAEATAREAGALLRRAYRQPIDIDYKGTINLVTQADRDSEAAIVAAIQARYPDHAILAEEGSGDGNHSSPDGLTWLIDPLDGTTNFAHRFPVFAVSLALRDSSDVLLGVVYDPLRDECFTALRGQGAKLNGEPIRVSTVEEIGRALLATGFPYDRQEAVDNNSAAFAAFLRRAQGIRRGGSAAMDLAYVACGRFDGYWEMRLNPWDWGAGLLLVREAGGVVTHYDGRDDLDSIFGEAKLAASNGRIHAAILATLAEVYAQRVADP